MKEKEIFLEVNSKKTYVRMFEESIEAPNIIFIMTPIVSVKEKLASSFMENLTEQNCNVFAIDFLGIGESEGIAKDISYMNMKVGILALISYINEKFTGNIHIYGGTGTGGIIGQALCSDPDIGFKITSYIQYGVGIFGDLSIMGNTSVLKMSYPIIQLLNYCIPNKKMKFKIPKYDGYNAKKENEWYSNTMKQYPGAFDLSFSLVYTLLKLFLDNSSMLKNKLKCPVLVLASKHDRYYNESYIGKYFDSLDAPKEIIWYENSHLAFLWNAKEINEKVIDWVVGKAK